VQRRDLGASKNMTIVLSGVFDALLIVLVVFVALAAAWPGVVLAVVALAASVWWQVTAVHTIERLGDGRFVLRSVARSEEMVPGLRSTRTRGPPLAGGRSHPPQPRASLPPLGWSRRIDSSRRLASGTPQPITAPPDRRWEAPQAPCATASGVPLGRRCGDGPAG
jgi:hypothetical protein